MSRRGEFRVDAQHRLELGDGLVDLSAVQQHRAQIVVGVGIFGIEFHGLLQVLEGRVGPPAAQQGRAETILGFRVVGLDGHGVLEVVEALLGFAALDQNPSQVAVRHPLERVEFQGRAVTVNRVFSHPQIFISHAEIGLGPRILRAFLHGVAPNREHGAIIAVAGERRAAEHHHQRG